VAKLVLAGGRVEVVLSQRERLAALRGDVSVDVGEIVDVRVSSHPFSELRGVRAPGTGMPGVIALGTWRHRGGKDFAAIYRGKPAVVLELAPGAEFGRITVGVDDPDAAVATIRASLPPAPTS
jgi:hypothetical protein